jgi:hypothetical protein
MGKAKIVANLGEGLYTVERDTGKAVIDAKILGLQSKLATVEQQIITVLNKRSQLDSQLIQARLNFELATEQYVAAVAGDPKASTTGWETAQKELLQLQAQYEESTLELEKLRASKASIAKEITALQSVNLVSRFDAWCADYTDDATGDVATIEIPGEPQNVLIAPGAPVPNAADGQVLARKAMTGPQAFFNAAILPGWQKFKPTYRRGVITALDRENNKANVTLLADPSSAQNLNINQSNELVDVPVVYSDCNASVFEVGDECVVQFMGQDWNSPQVVGFMSEPRECGYTYCIFVVFPLGSTFFGTRNYDLSPLFPDYYQIGSDRVVCGFSPNVPLDGWPFPQQFKAWATYDPDTNTELGAGVKQIRGIRTNSLIGATLNPLAETTTVPIVGQKNIAGGASVPVGGGFNSGPIIHPLVLDPSAIDMPLMTVQSFTNGGGQCIPLGAQEAGKILLSDMLIESSLSGQTVTISIKGNERQVGYGVQVGPSVVYAVFGFKFYAFGGSPPPDRVLTFRTISFGIEKFPILYGKYPPIKIVNVVDNPPPGSPVTYIYVAYSKKLYDEQ